MCERCLRYFPKAENYCEGCGINLVNNLANIFCGRCLSKPMPYQRSISGFWYKEPLRTLIRDYKFNQQLHLTPVLGKLMLDAIQHDYQEKNLAYPAVIIPMPIHPKRLKERGYHQTHELAKVLSKKLSIPIDLKACQRTRHTTPQADLPFKERKKNVQSVFKAQKIASQHIALIDDVITTGETIASLSRALLKDNPRLIIDVWSLARTKID